MAAAKANDPAEVARDVAARIAVFEDKIEEYYLSFMPDIASRPDRHSFLPLWPVYRFSIRRLHEALLGRVASALLPACAEKLIDIKLHYVYLKTVTDIFLHGPTLIVGNGELEKLNPSTISLLRGIHYRVYLLSVLIEQTLDFLHVTLEGRPSNFKNGKWNKIIERVRDRTQDAIITASDAALLVAFKLKFRTAEMHKHSMVRALTSKAEWTHLQLEEEAAERILVNMSRYYVGLPEAA